MSSRNRKKLGAWGEQVAAQHLKDLGYQIIAFNYHTRFGEIDLICREKDTWCFVEVKTRRSSKYGAGFEAINGKKRKHMVLAAQQYLDQANLFDVPVRFDMVSIELISNSEYRIELFQNAFSL